MRRWTWVLLLCLALISSCVSVEYTCDGTPDLRSPARASDHFAIRISGNPETYSPLRKYQVSIEPTRQGLQQKMTGFALTVESSRASRDADVGMFQLIDEALTAFSHACPHMVTQTSNRLISEMAVHWVAPPSTSGCITFRATVIEPGEQWTRHEGPLTRTICEDAESADDVSVEVKDCCACDEAKYEVTFEGLWSRHTHPKDFPPNGWLTRFSDVIGASHTSDYRFWQYGELASEGLKQVAERGWTRMLESELKSQSENIRTIIKARGISYPNVTGKTFAVFRVDRQHHLMSLVSMIVPSPDWIVGVSGLELCLSNCSWLESKVINLNPWDVGTDSGVTYTSPDDPTEPAQPITQITSSNPNNSGSPFFDQTGEKMKPLARLHITRQRLYEKSCQDDSIGADEEENPDCAVHEWVEQPCSVTCGRGVKYYQRSYRNNDLALMAKCSVELTKREPCQGERWCTGEPQILDQDRRPLAADHRCDVTEWGEWSSCSATCGHDAVMTRSREYRMRGARKICTDTHELQQTQACDLPPCSEDNEQQERERCEPQWSDWTPCSVTCGTGVKSRTTAGHSYSSDGTKCSGHPRTVQVQCQGVLPDCGLTEHNMTDLCLLGVSLGDPGCHMQLERWYFDKVWVECRGFTYSGCKGNGNSFTTKEECENACAPVVDGLNGLHELGAMGVVDLKILKSMAFDKSPVQEEVEVDPSEATPLNDSEPLQQHEEGAEGTEREDDFRGIPPLSQQNSSYYNYSVQEGRESVNCKTTSWSKWSPCSVTCGRGIKKRHRRIKVHPHGGGKPCPVLVMERKCKTPKCEEEQVPSDSAESLPTWGEAEPARHRNRDCVAGPWSGWSPCSASCGITAFQFRTRKVIHATSAEKCPHFEDRSCNLLPCV